MTSLPLWVKRRCAKSENLPTCRRKKSYFRYTLTIWYWILLNFKRPGTGFSIYGQKLAVDWPAGRRRAERRGRRVGSRRRRDLRWRSWTECADCAGERQPAGPARYRPHTHRRTHSAKPFCTTKTTNLEANTHGKDHNWTSPQCYLPC